MDRPTPPQSSLRDRLGLATPGRRRRSAAVLRLAALTALVAGLAAAPAGAQPPYRQEVVTMFSFDVGMFSNPDVADLDGDGDLDVVAGEEFGALVYFENVGSAASPAFVMRGPGAGPVAGVAVGVQSAPEFADLDGDADLDAVVGEWEGTLRYFENTGSPTAAAFVERTGGANPFNGIDVGLESDPELADVDADGDLDALVGENEAGLRYFENVGSAVAAVFEERTGAANPFDGIVAGGDFSSSPVLFDIDGDGDLDLGIGHYIGFPTDYFENVGSPAAPAFTERTGLANPVRLLSFSESGTTPQLADLDDDGDLDAVVGDQWGGLKYFENQGTPTSADLVQTWGVLMGLDVHIGAGPALADLDADGDLDAAVDVVQGVGNEWDSMLHFENVGTATDPDFTWTLDPQPLRNLGDSAPEFADLDGDGDLDAATGFSGAILYYENVGAPSDPVFELRVGPGNNPFDGIDVGDTATPEIADLDGDGDLDAVSGEQEGTLKYFENTGSPTVPILVERTGGANPFDGFDVGFYSHPVLVDFDRDGDLDAAVGESPQFFGLPGGTMKYLENVGSPTAPAFVERAGQANPFAAVYVGHGCHPDVVDLDADGDFDVLVGETGGRIVFYRSSFMVFTDGFESGDLLAWSTSVP